MSESFFPVQINVNENKNLARDAYPIRLGIPFPSNELHDINILSLTNSNGDHINFQAKVTGLWFDKSIRWLLLEFFCTIQKGLELTYYLDSKTNPSLVDKFKPINVQQLKDEILIDTGTTQFHINTLHFCPFNQVSHLGNANQFNSSIELLSVGNSSFNAVVDSVNYSQQPNTVSTTIELNGHFSNDEHSSILSFKSSLTFYAETALCELEFTIHNPNAADHAGGFWDLGDPGSEFFKSLILYFNFESGLSSEWKNKSDPSWNTLNNNNVRLYQDSSGGNRWNHHIHSDKDNQSTVSFKGYQLKQKQSITHEGLRASPIFSVKNTADATLTAHIKQFWQNFPKALSITDNQLNIEIFPATPKSDYELQAGEQKSHKILLNFDNNKCLIEQVTTPLQTSLSLSTYAHSFAMPWLSDHQYISSIDDIIQQGIHGKHNFFYKRDKTDEYGWRNFGELWADHETLEHGNDDSLITHYNNQYDPINGFARQYLLTGELKWFELMDDLAHHVIDIDIYHTSLDRPEYSHGLFWHTDHYLDGRHCTHRTFSKSHMDVDHVEQAGGGPGIEHCYTSGLVSHYYLTGSEASKKAVLELTEWIETLFDGSPSILARSLKFLKHDLKFIKKIATGHKINWHKHPFTRGTGNYINTLLDAYQLTQNKRYIDKVSDLIKNVISPYDDISLRRLDDPEETWSHIILLQSIMKFLNTKLIEKNFDEAFYYAHDSFLHYVDWLVKNEIPYLEKPERLVYPNDTWTAQDIRKAQVFYFAYLIKQKKCYKTKANQFLSYINEHLNEEHTYKSTRILCILAQNQFNMEHQLSIEIPSKTEEYRWNDPTKAHIHTVLFSFLAELSKRLLKFSFASEIKWLKQRLKS